MLIPGIARGNWARYNVRSILPVEIISWDLNESNPTVVNLEIIFLAISTNTSNLFK